MQTNSFSQSQTNFQFQSNPLLENTDIPKLLRDELEHLD